MNQIQTRSGESIQRERKRMFIKPSLFFLQVQVVYDAKILKAFPNEKLYLVEGRKIAKMIFF